MSDLRSNLKGLPLLKTLETNPLKKELENSINVDFKSAWISFISYSSQPS